MDDTRNVKFKRRRCRRPKLEGKKHKREEALNGDEMNYRTIMVTVVIWQKTNGYEIWLGSAGTVVALSALCCMNTLLNEM